MKKIHFIAVALMATITTWAQNIAVVSPSNVTKVRQTLDEAISEAEDGSIIYLPGGGFQIKDETIITKKTISIINILKIVFITFSNNFIDTPLMFLQNTD